ncbi:MAG: DUF4340 domain-containing protein [Cyanobacteria bacterium P01_H01_bin.26]
MKLQRSTGILLGVAIALVAAVVTIEITQNSQPDSGDTLYSFTESDVTAFTINRDNTAMSFIKTDDTWHMEKPRTALADPSAVAFLLNIITSNAIEETFTTTPEQLDEYGLDTPVATLELTVEEESHALFIGEEDFSDTSLYVMTANPTESDPVEIHLISKDLENGFERPVNDWILSQEEATRADQESQEQSENRPEEPSSLEQSDTGNTTN